MISVDSIGPVSQDIYLPNIPDVKADFGISDSMVTATIQLNIIATAVGSLVIGSLADRYGRRPVLIASLTLYVVSVIVAALSEHIVLFLVARIFMGFGQGSQVMAAVLARDLIDDVAQRLRAMAVLATVNSVAVALAPTLGGFIGQFGTWRIIFWFLGAWVVLTLVGFICTMPETKPQAKLEALPAPACASKRCESALHRFMDTTRTIFGSRVYVGFVGLFALMFAAIMAMLTLLPFLLENHYGLPVSLTGVLTGVIPVCGFSGSLISMALSKYVIPFQIVRLGMFPYFLVFVLLLAMTFLHQELPFSAMTWWPVLVPCILMLMMQNLFIPVAMSFALEEFEDKAGVAQGAAMCIQALAMALGSKVAIALWDGTPRSFYGTLAMIIGVAQLWFWLILGLCPPARLRIADSMPHGKDVHEISSIIAVRDGGSTSTDEESVSKAASASPEMNHVLPIGVSV